DAAVRLASEEEQPPRLVGGEREAGVHRLEPRAQRAGQENERALVGRARRGRIARRHRGSRAAPARAAQQRLLMRAALRPGQALRSCGVPSSMRAYLGLMPREPQPPDASSPQREGAGAGLAAQRAGQVEEAIAHYRRALALDPDMPVVLGNLGGALVSLRRPAEAVPLLRRALALPPHYAPPLGDLAAALNALGRWDEALPLLERTLAATPAYAPVLLNLGQALLHLGRFDAGIARLREAIAADPASVAAHQALGQALVRINRLSEA